MKNTTGKRDAFSLLELLAVVAIIGTLAALIIPRLSGNSSNAKIKTCFHNRTTINSTVERYYLDQGVWPADNLSDIGADINYFPQGISTCPFSGSAYRIDQTTRRVIGHKGSDGKGTADHY